MLGLAKPNGTECYGFKAFGRTLALAPGENRIEVVAYNAKGIVASIPVQMTVTSTRPASTKPPKLYVLAAGVNAYRAAGLEPLKFAKADANAIGASLQTGERPAVRGRRGHYTAGSGGHSSKAR